MRCLTLADELKAQGHECLFICRNHDGNLGEYIKAKGFSLYRLDVSKDLALTDVSRRWNNHAEWLGVSQQDDAQQTIEVLKVVPSDWLVVDHYAIDATWEHLVAKHVKRLMVIDDLVDRNHECDLLLDQTYRRSKDEYEHLVPTGCQVLSGTQYALLRPEFRALRSSSLARRSRTQLSQLLIAMGGVDKDNMTAKILDAVSTSGLSAECKIVIVMGPNAPWIENVKIAAEKLPWNTQVWVGVSNMAEIMANSDLAIGAAGATSWERCCLGLPTLLFVLADNQREIACALEGAGAVQYMQGDEMQKLLTCVSLLAVDPSSLKGMSDACAALVDGSGVQRVLKQMLSL